MTNTDEFTETQMQELENASLRYELIQQYRTAHGITWGGPPYSTAELDYMNSRLLANPEKP